MPMNHLTAYRIKKQLEQTNTILLATIALQLINFILSLT